MSSALRTMQKKILKNQGFRRDKNTGDIVSPNGNVVSRVPRTSKDEDDYIPAPWPLYTKEPAA